MKNREQRDDPEYRAAAMVGLYVVIPVLQTQLS